MARSAALLMISIGVRGVSHASLAWRESRQQCRADARTWLETSFFRIPLHPKFFRYNAGDPSTEPIGHSCHRESTVTNGPEPKRRDLIPGYTLNVDRQRVVFGGRRLVDHLPVIVKAVAGDAVSEKDVVRLTREYEILHETRDRGRHQGAGLSETYATCAGHGGSRWRIAAKVLIDAGRIDLQAFLAPACRLCEGTCRNASARHCAPRRHANNVVVNVATGQVRLIDFGIAVQMAVESCTARADALEGTLAYLAPEQSGRMNRAADHRGRSVLLRSHPLRDRDRPGAVPVGRSARAHPVHLAKVPIGAPAPLRPEVRPRCPRSSCGCSRKKPRMRYQGAQGR